MPMPSSPLKKKQVGSCQRQVAFLIQNSKFGQIHLSIEASVHVAHTPQVYISLPELQKCF